MQDHIKRAALVINGKDTRQLVPVDQIKLVEASTPNGGPDRLKIHLLGNGDSVEITGLQVTSIFEALCELFN